jgi:hypothetical protein
MSISPHFGAFNIHLGGKINLKRAFQQLDTALKNPIEPPVEDYIAASEGRYPDTEVPTIYDFVTVPEQSPGTLFVSCHANHNAHYQGIVKQHYPSATFTDA